MRIALLLIGSVCFAQMTDLQLWRMMVDQDRREQEEGKRAVEHQQARCAIYRERLVAAILASGSSTIDARHYDRQRDADRLKPVKAAWKLYLIACDR